MYSLQVQGTDDTEEVQAVRILHGFYLVWNLMNISFELGGEKKTKGAALTFVGFSPLLTVYILTGLPSNHLFFVFLCTSCSRNDYAITVPLPMPHVSSLFPKIWMNPEIWTTLRFPNDKAVIYRYHEYIIRMSKAYCRTPIS